MYPALRICGLLWRRLRQLLGYAVYFSSLGLFLLVLAPVLACMSPWPRLRLKIAGRIVPAYLELLAHRVLPALGVYRILELSGFGRAAACGNAVYAANHRSGIDALILLPVIRSSAVVLKSKHARKPVFNLLARFSDFVNMDQSSMAALSAAIEKCRRLLDGGANLLIFPEGMRGSGARIAPFRDLAFRLSIETGKPVAPVVIHADREFLARTPGSIFPNGTVNYRFRCLDPIFAGPGETAGQFAQRVYLAMAEESGKMTVLNE